MPLRGIDLESTLFDNADLRKGIQFAGSELRGASFASCKFPPNTDLSNFDLRQCCFSSQDLSKDDSIVLNWKSIDGADFTSVTPPPHWDLGRADIGMQGCSGSG